MSDDLTEINACPKCNKTFTSLEFRAHECEKILTPGELYEKRKYKLFIVAQQEILKLLTGEAIIINFPDKAVFADCGYRIDAQGFAILVCHESYEEVPVNEAAPFINVEWRKLR